MCISPGVCVEKTLLGCRFMKIFDISFWRKPEMITSLLIHSDFYTVNVKEGQYFLY